MQTITLYSYKGGVGRTLALAHFAHYLALLGQKGSLFATRPTLFTFLADRGRLERMARDLFRVVQSGEVRISVSARVPLAEASRAHAALEARETTGSTVLLP